MALPWAGGRPPARPGAYAACWCPTGPPGTPPLRSASGGCGNPKGKAKVSSTRGVPSRHGSRSCPPVPPHPRDPAGRGRTRSRRTLLEMATLKGWNLLMAAKGVTSTRVWGFLEEPQPLVPRAPRGPQPSPPPQRLPRGRWPCGDTAGATRGAQAPAPSRPTWPCHGCPGCSSGRAPGVCSPAFSPGGHGLQHRAPRHRGRGAWPPLGDPALPHPSPPAPPGSGTAASCSSPPVSWRQPAPARAPGLPSPPPPPPPRAARPPRPRWPSSAVFREQSVAQRPAGMPPGHPGAGI